MCEKQSTFDNAVKVSKEDNYLSIVFVFLIPFYTPTHSDAQHAYEEKGKKGLYGDQPSLAGYRSA